MDPTPHSSGSTACVFLADNGLPNLNLWTRQFKGCIRETYGLRGFEAAVTGTVEVRDDDIVLVADGARLLLSQKERFNGTRLLEVRMQSRRKRPTRTTNLSNQRHQVALDE